MDVAPLSFPYSACDLTKAGPKPTRHKASTGAFGAEMRQEPKVWMFVNATENWFIRKSVAISFMAEASCPN